MAGDQQDVIIRSFQQLKRMQHIADLQGGIPAGKSAVLARKVKPENIKDQMLYDAFETGSEDAAECALVQFRLVF